MYACGCICEWQEGSLKIPCIIQGTAANEMEVRIFLISRNLSTEMFRLMPHWLLDGSIEHDHECEYSTHAAANVRV